MGFLESFKQLLKHCGHAMNVTVHERLDKVDDILGEFSETHTALLQSSIHVVEKMERIRKSQENQPKELWVEAADYSLANPEVGLMCFLYSYLPTRTAIEVGAHVGDVTEPLLRTGFEVYAFEPFPASFEKLTARCGNTRGLRAFDLAIGSSAGEARLHLAADTTAEKLYGDASVFHSLSEHHLTEGLVFTESIPVAVQTLAELHRAGAVPADASLVKIDTEGHDLEVIRGMGEHRYPVIAAEFWDRRLPFQSAAARYGLPDLVREMRERGYDWFIVMYRVWGAPKVSFFANRDESVPKSWGNVFFFRDRNVFAQAQEWCAAVLPRTYFKPPSGLDG